MESIWLAIALFFIIEGIGPMLFPNKWKVYIRLMSRLPSSQIQMTGGIFVVIGAVSTWLLLN